MKKKLLLTALAVLLCSMLFALLAVTVSAEEGITVTYNWYNGSVWETAQPNADGSYTLRTSKKSGNGTVKLADGTTVDKEFYGWFDEEGNIYTPGQTVTFEKSTRIYEAYGITVNNADDLYAVLSPSQSSPYVRLGADIEIGRQLWSEWDTTVIDLNGHNIVSTSDGHFMHVKRGAFIMLGEGTVTHNPATTNKDDRGFVRFEAHGYADENNPQLFWIGKGVKITTPYHLLYDTNIKDGYNMPDIVIAGEVNAKTVARINPNIETARCYLYESAKLNLTTDFIQFRTQTNSVIYMYITLNGEINIANGQGSTLFNEFILLRTDIAVNGGKFCLPATDYEYIKYYLDDTLMLKEVVDGEVTYMEIVPSDCAHEWVKDMEQSVEAVLGTNGKDVFNCSLCQRTKTVITVYDVSNIEIEIIVVDENGERKAVTVRAGDVLVYDVTGVGENSSFTLVSVKGSEKYPAETIVGIQITTGVAAAQVTESNSTLEQIVILDGANISLENLSGFKALKTIEIGASSVTFKTGVKTVAETIKSEKAGANVAFDGKSFNKVATLKNLVLSAESTYSFGQDSFRECGLTELILPDNSTVSWGNTAFAECQQLEYIYIGSNIGVKQVTNGSAVFDGISNLKKAVIMDLTYLGEWAFSTKAPGKQYGPLCDLTMYIHSEALTMHANAFNTRNGNYHVYIYTMQTTLPSTINNCNRTIYQGIGHAYAEQVITESTCITQGTFGYATDCPCGIDYRENAYTSYSSFDSSLNNVSHEAVGSEIKNLPLSEIHVMGEALADIVYENYFANGTKYYYCSVCGEATLPEDEPSASSLFIAAGYSVADGDSKSVSHTIKVNREAINAYKEIGHDFYFGAVAAINSDGAPVLGVNAAKEGVIMLDMTNTVFDLITVKIVGIPEDSVGVGLNCCAFAIENGDTPIIKYLCGEATLDKAESVSYSALAELQPETTVPSDDEE